MSEAVRQLKSRSAAFALLIPATPAATAALNLRANRLRRENPEPYLGLPQLHGHSIIAKLDFAFIFGRRCLSFGSARQCEFRLPPSPGVCDSHFLIHFDLGTHNLNITDVSGRGTWIRTEAGGSFKHLVYGTSAIGRTATIRVDEDTVFVLVVMTSAQGNDSGFDHLFHDYKMSVKGRLGTSVGRAERRGTIRKASQDIVGIKRKRASIAMVSSQSSGHPLHIVKWAKRAGNASRGRFRVG